MPCTLFLDIETLPLGWEEWGPSIRDGVPPDIALEQVLRQLGDKHPPKTYGAEAQAKWYARQYEGVNDEAIAWYKRSSVDPKRGQVLCVGFAVNEDDPEVLWGGPPETELDCLRRLEALLTQVQPARIVAWRGRGFDFPFLWERSIGYRAFNLCKWFASPPHYSATRIAKVPQTPAQLVDPHDLWSTTRESRDTIAATAAFLGVSAQNPITGGGVLDAMVAGQPEVVREHVTADVLDLRSIWEVLAPAIGLAL